MLKLNVGAAKKVGEANYGSRGASVNLEMELESDLVAQPARLRERIRQLFGLAKESVEEELNGGGQHASPATTNGNARQPDGRSATQSQLRAIHAIADRHHVGLPELLRDDYCVTQASELSISQASQLIDQLKAQANGTGGRI